MTLSLSLSTGLEYLGWSHTQAVFWRQRDLFSCKASDSELRSPHRLRKRQAESRCALKPAKLVPKSTSTQRSVRPSTATVVLVLRPPRSQRRIVECAVRQNGLALQWASEERWRDPPPVLVAKKHMHKKPTGPEIRMGCWRIWG